MRNFFSTAFFGALCVAIIGTMTIFLVFPDLGKWMVFVDLTMFIAYFLIADLKSNE